MKRREEPIAGLSAGLTHVLLTGVVLLVAFPSLAPLRQFQIKPAPSARTGIPPVAARAITANPLPQASGVETTAEEGIKDEWPEADVTAAREQCMHLLSSQPMEFEILDPIKKGECGLPAPVRLKSIGSAAQKVVFNPPVDVNCRLAAALGKWAKSALQPGARSLFKSQVVSIIGASGYSCRNIYNRPNARLSQHALANAIDIGGFVLANGRTIGVLKGWGPTERDLVAQAKAKAKAEAEAKKKGLRGETAVAKAAGETVSKASMTPSLQAAGKKPLQGGLPGAKAAVAPPKNPVDAKFLREIHDGACDEFGTVLGPEANDPHRNHFHLDLIARRGRGFCE